ncbi:MAG: hypothetical protein HY519_01450, partial [Candidatus Aenigmarchaeota archaeon]|nr:hypothetical protein [Candidatus Aenigmarchaeota archaeon]
MGIEAGKLASASLKLIYHKPIVLIPLLLHFVLATALQAVFVPDLNLLLDSASETAAAQVLTAALPGIALALAVSFLLWVFFYAMATKLVHSARTARAISYADAVHTAKSRYFQYLLLNLIYIHLALAGAALLVVPVFAILLAASSGSFLAIALVSVLGFVWLVALLIIGAVGFLRISLSHYYLVLEGKSAVQSLVASWRATKGNVASLLFLLLIVMAVGIAVSVAVGLA